MIDITFNIGYEGPLGSGLLNIFPIYHELESFKEFSDSIRKYAFEWSLWAHENHVSKSYLCFYVNIWEKDTKSEDDEYWNWQFTIRAKNIREFQPLLKLTREVVDEMKIQKERENKLQELLNSDSEIS